MCGNKRFIWHIENNILVLYNENKLCNKSECEIKLLTKLYVFYWINPPPLTLNNEGCRIITKMATPTKVSCGTKSYQII